MTTFRFEAIGTVWQIDIFQDVEALAEAALLSRITDRIDVFDKDYSRFRADSLVTKMSKEPGKYTLPADAKKLFDLYADLYTRTGGLVTPLIGNLIADAGYDANYSFTQKDLLQAPPSWDEALEYSYPDLTIKQPVLLDVGAAGKGYIIDIVGEILKQAGVENYCIDAGGDILYHNSESLRVGLEHPLNSEQVIGVYTLSRGSMCGSAGNRRVWNDFTHIINPHTKVSPKDILAVWVVAKDALIADGLATCLFFVSPEKLSDGYDFDYLIMYSDSSIECSPHFVVELF
jgi:FAD:protein FMN transferase